MWGKSTAAFFLGLPLAVAPWAIGGTGAIYGVSALVLSAMFLAYSVPVGLRRTVLSDSGPSDAMKPEKRLFKFSILYLFALFGMLVADRLATVQGWQA